MSILGLLLVLAWIWKPLSGDAMTAAAYGAHTACACRYIGGRSLAACRADFMEGMGAIRLTEDVKARSVTAHFPLLASQTATYREGQGCMLEPWTRR